MWESAIRSIMAPSVVGLEGTIRSGKGESNPGNHELSDSGEIPGKHDSDDSPGHGASRWPVRRTRPLRVLVTTKSLLVTTEDMTVPDWFDPGQVDSVV